MSDEYRVAVIINYSGEGLVAAVETIWIQQPAEYSAALMRFYAVLEAENLARQGLNLVVIAPPGPLSSYLGWTKDVEGVRFIDAEEVAEPFSLLDVTVTNSSNKVYAAQELIPDEIQETGLLDTLSLQKEPVLLNTLVVEAAKNNEDDVLISPASLKVAEPIFQLRREPKRSYHLNNFVTYLSSYNTTGAGHSRAYQEYFKDKNDYLAIETTTEKYLLQLFSKDNLSSGKGTSVILTGNAGDGKTRLCRLVWENLAPDLDFGEASKNYKDSEIDLLNECKVKVKIIKDFSDWDEKIGIKLLKLVMAGIDEAGIPTVYLIAANEGRLRKILQHGDLQPLQEHVEAILEDKLSDNGPVVLNLNRVSTSIFIPELLGKMTHAAHWKACAGCPASDYCPIKWNRDQLTQPTPADRLYRLYNIIEQLDRHVTFRDALIHLTYTITGRWNCRKVQSVSEEQRPLFAKWVYYRNCYGDEEPHTFQTQGVAGSLRLFDVSAVSHFHTDELLLKGHLLADQVLQQYIVTNFRQGFDFGSDLFESALRNYLNPQEEKTTTKNTLKTSDQTFDLMNWWLPQLRRKFYFEWPEHLSPKFPPYVLIPLKSYMDVQKLLNNSTPLERDEWAKNLVKALNRVFAQLFIDERGKLYVSSFNALSTQLPVPIIRDSINSDKIHLFKEDENLLNQQIDSVSNKLILQVPTTKDTYVNLTLNLLAFEYLWQIQAGGSLAYLEEECGLTISRFQKELLANLTQINIGQDKMVRVFVYQGGKPVIQSFSLFDDGKLQVKKD